MKMTEGRTKGHLPLQQSPLLPQRRGRTNTQSFPMEKDFRLQRIPKTTDLSVAGSKPAVDGNLFNCKRGSTAHSLHFQTLIVLI